MLTQIFETYINYEYKILLVSFTFQISLSYRKISQVIYLFLFVTLHNGNENLPPRELMGKISCLSWLRALILNPTGLMTLGGSWEGET